MLRLMMGERDDENMFSLFEVTGDLYSEPVSLEKAGAFETEIEAFQSRHV